MWKRQISKSDLLQAGTPKLTSCSRVGKQRSSYFDHQSEASLICKRVLCFRIIRVLGSRIQQLTFRLYRISILFLLVLAIRMGGLPEKVIITTKYDRVITFICLAKGIASTEISIS